MRVLYPGGYDLLHEGHINALHTARRIAGPNGRLIAAVNTDALMTAYKRPPARPLTERIWDVDRAGIANAVIAWDGPEGQAEQILSHRPDIYIAGTDWLTKDLAHQLRIPSLGWFDEHGISLMYLRRTPGISTTQLIDGKA